MISQHPDRFFRPSLFPHHNICQVGLQQSLPGHVVWYVGSRACALIQLAALEQEDRTKSPKERERAVGYMLNELCLLCFLEPYGR